MWIWFTSKWRQTSLYLKKYFILKNLCWFTQLLTAKVSFSQAETSKAQNTWPIHIRNFSGILLMKQLGKANRRKQPLCANSEKKENSIKKQFLLLKATLLILSTTFRKNARGVHEIRTCRAENLNYFGKMGRLIFKPRNCFATLQRVELEIPMNIIFLILYIILFEEIKWHVFYCNTRRTITTDSLQKIQWKRQGRKQKSAQEQRLKAGLKKHSNRIWKEKLQELNWEEKDPITASRAKRNSLGKRI